MASRVKGNTAADLQRRIEALEAENAELRAQFGRPSATAVPVTAQQMSLVADLIPGLAGYVGSDERYWYNNKAFEHWLGCRRAEMRGRTVAEVVGDVAYDVLRPLIDTALGGEAVTAERELIFPDGTARFVHIAFVPYISPAAVPQGFFQFITDLTEARRAGALMRESERRLQDLLDAMPIVVFTKDCEGRHLFVNRAFEAATGRSRAQVIGRTDHELYPADPADRFAASDAEALANGTVSFEMAEVTHGMVQTYQITKVPMRDSEGRIEGVCGIAVDVTERKTFEAHQRLLVDELNHRVKNTLAIVQSLAQQSLKSADGDARRAFERRLNALASAHSLLTRENWTGVSFGSIVETAVAPYADLDRLRFRISGPDLRLAPKTAVSLTMALHELATNAAKYGALSAPDGRVEIMWHTLPPASEPRLRFEWRERGGPPVVPPARPGFGSRMVEYALAAELGGEVELRYEPAGVVCAIEAPLPSP